MATGRGNTLTGQLAEHLVCAELARRGLIATTFFLHFHGARPASRCHQELPRLAARLQRPQAEELGVVGLLVGRHRLGEIRGQLAADYRPARNRQS